MVFVTFFTKNLEYVGIFRRTHVLRPILYLIYISFFQHIQAHFMSRNGLLEKARCR